MKEGRLGGNARESCYSVQLKGIINPQKQSRKGGSKKYPRGSEMGPSAGTADSKKVPPTETVEQSSSCKLMLS